MLSIVVLLKQSCTKTITQNKRMGSAQGGQCYQLLSHWNNFVPRLSHKIKGWVLLKGVNNINCCPTETILYQDYHTKLKDWFCSRGSMQSIVVLLKQFCTKIITQNKRMGSAQRGQCYQLLSY